MDRMSLCDTERKFTLKSAAVGLKRENSVSRALMDYYNYGIRLMNDRQVDEAEHHLGEALKRDPNADHVHYATAVLQAIKGDTAGVHRSLSRAIELNPRNRPLALNDSDLATVREDPSISDLLRPQATPRS